MIAAKRMSSRRTVSLAQDPAAWHAMAAQQAWRLRGVCPPLCSAPAPRPTGELLFATVQRAAHLIAILAIHRPTHRSSSRNLS